MVKAAIHSVNSKYKIQQLKTDFEHKNQGRGFPRTSVFGKATLDLVEKAGRTLARFSRFFQSHSRNQPGFGNGSVYPVWAARTDDVKFRHILVKDVIFLPIFLNFM
ncbi:MAG: hypothetical protein LBF63_11090 [Treponema sp.]|jgi:hypothetical protein|nr:hypothetical protein [Treponema sp.]